jgi:hypothetical protein
MTFSGFSLHFPDPEPRYFRHGASDYERWTALEGRLWCYGEILTYHSATGDNVLPKILADWDSGKLDHTRLNGRFALFIRDAVRDEWEVITDRFGAIHVYAGMDGEQIRVISSHPFGASASHELDWKAIGSFCTFGFFLDDLTWFTDVRILQPASIYRFSTAGIQISHERYWKWHHTIDEQRTYDETLEQYHHLMGQAVQRCLSSQPVLPISGGLDSRSLAAYLPSRSISYSYGYTRDSKETHIAARIGKARDFQHTSHTIETYLFDRLDEVVWALHGCQDVTQARQCSVNGWVSQHGKAVLTGLWGDVWCDQMGLADGMPAGMTSATHAMQKFQKKGRAWLIERLVQPQLDGENIQEWLTGRVEQGIQSFSFIDDLDFREKAYKTTRWAFRWSNASLRGFALGATPRIPYYDIDLADFFCTAPTAFVRDRRLQIDHLKRYFPDLAIIQWQSAGVNLYWQQYGQWLTLPERVVNKARRTLSNAAVIQRNWEVQFLSRSGREQLEGVLLANNTPLLNWVSSSVVKALIDSFYLQPTAANGYTVSMLLTIGAWLKLVREYTPLNDHTTY